jgi:outer membrane receptor protein involved in Fe transport
MTSGALDLDAGVRHETFKSDAVYSGSKQLVGGMDVNGDGKITGAEKNVYVADTANPGLSNYSVSYTNYSLGANYRINGNLSAFAHYSEGNRAIADRLLYSANINATTGQLSPGGGAAAAVAPVKQTEFGLRNRGKASWGNYAVAATLFHSTTKEFDYDQTRQDNPALPNYQGPKLNVVGYKADGIELETGGSMGKFALTFNVVYSNEVITSNLGDPSAVGKTSGGVPKWRYTISPRYAIGDAVIGATVRGQGKLFADGGNTQTIDGHYVVNAFVNYDFGKGLVGSLNVNNLFDKVYPTGGGGFVNGSNTIFGSGVETGRTLSASMRYSF